MGRRPILNIVFHKGDIALMHTEVPEKLGGRGIATALAEYALNYARDQKYPSWSIVLSLAPT